MQIVEEDAAGVTRFFLALYWMSTSLRAVGALPRNTSRPVQGETARWSPVVAVFRD